MNLKDKDAGQSYYSCWESGVGKNTAVNWKNLHAGPKNQEVFGSGDVAFYLFSEASLRHINTRKGPSDPTGTAWKKATSIPSIYYGPGHREQFFFSRLADLTPTCMNGIICGS